MKTNALNACFDCRLLNYVSQNQVEALKAKVSEKDFQLSETARRVLELENELDCQSLAMEKQRAVASSKVQTISRL